MQVSSDYQGALEASDRDDPSQPVNEEQEAYSAVEMMEGLLHDVDTTIMSSRNEMASVRESAASTFGMGYTNMVASNKMPMHMDDTSGLDISDKTAAKLRDIRLTDDALPQQDVGY